MIQETIVTTQNLSGIAHIAPMGVHVHKQGLIILPFRPSTTLDNLLATEVAVINYCTDVRIFAGCLTGRRDWPLRAAAQIAAPVLLDALAHKEVKVTHIEDDPYRPKIYCKTVHTANHAPFTGFNRAQNAVLEVAILVSRLNLLPPEKIDADLEYLRVGFEKTAGEHEREAWAWLMEAIADFKAGTQA